MDAANFRYLHPQGPLYGWFSRAGLQRLELPLPGQPRTLPVLHSAANDGRGRLLARALEAYFAGMAVDFADIPLDPAGATPFRRAVWEAARTVGWGQISTYAGLAEALGKGPGSARAVGAALGANPIAIVIPCHRFLASDGGLQGYAAGLAWKEALLRLEGALL